MEWIIILFIVGGLLCAPRFIAGIFAVIAFLFVGAAVLTFVGVLVGFAILVLLVLKSLL